MSISFLKKRLMIDINCNPLVELKKFFFVLVLKFFVDGLLRLFSEDLETLLLIGLLNTRYETK